MITKSYCYDFAKKLPKTINDNNYATRYIEFKVWGRFETSLEYKESDGTVSTGYTIKTKPIKHAIHKDIRIVGELYRKTNTSQGIKVKRKALKECEIILYRYYKDVETQLTNILYAKSTDQIQKEELIEELSMNYRKPDDMFTTFERYNLGGYGKTYKGVLNKEVEKLLEEHSENVIGPVIQRLWTYAEVDVDFKGQYVYVTLYKY